MNLETSRNEFRSSSSQISPKHRFSIAAFPNWAELFQHLQTKNFGILDVQPRGLIGLQHLWPPERRFDVHQLEELGTVTRFTLHNPLQNGLLLRRSCSTTHFESGWGGRLQLD
jgi:hypothetical protein